MQRTKMTMFACLLFCFMLSTVNAMTIDVIGFGDSDWGVGESPGILGERDHWDDVKEMENLYTDGEISASGSYYVYDPSPVDPGWGGVIWVFSGSVQSVFNNAPTDTLFVQFESDRNDGWANFYIDGVLSYSLNTYNGSWFAVTFSGLALQNHTLMVTAAGGGDLAIDAMGATHANSAVPEPAAMVLFGAGLAGLSAIMRKRK
ncbi:PEP-CTERM sorting domain-containing protein [Desulfogranum japonicum]|uniref:PEP-CTERM sorting domain-containing protein n=1 Tax=Desulfogranum japonicum TaxID=231447 RepID=UPI0004157CB4|nr:PEP-CTERM sorting domain-containing protein [Desulfogranum japonicum]